MAQFTDRALLLKRSPYGESSLVAHLLTRDHGRVHVIAKGAYRHTSRFYCVLDLFDTLDITWSHSPRRELQLLVQGTVRDRRRVIRSELARYEAAVSMLELTDLAARPAHVDTALYDGLEAGLSALEQEDAPWGLVLVVFELAFLQNLGLAPACERCAACGGPAEAVDQEGTRAAFSAGAGGRLCLACAAEARDSGRRVGTLPVEILEIAARLRQTPYSSLSRFELDPNLIDRVRDFVERFMDYHLETRPRSHRQFLSTPNRNAPPARK